MSLEKLKRENVDPEQHEQLDTILNRVKARRIPKPKSVGTSIEEYNKAGNDEGILSAAESESLAKFIKKVREEIAMVSMDIIGVKVSRAPEFGEHLKQILILGEFKGYKACLRIVTTDLDANGHCTRIEGMGFKMPKYIDWDARPKKSTTKLDVDWTKDYPGWASFADEIANTMVKILERYDTGEISLIEPQRPSDYAYDPRVKSALSKRPPAGKEIGDSVQEFNNATNINYMNQFEVDRLGRLSRMIQYHLDAAGISLAGIKVAGYRDTDEWGGVVNTPLTEKLCSFVSIAQLE